MGQLVRPGAFGKAGGLRCLVVMDRLGKGLGNAAIGEDGSREFRVIYPQTLALQFQDRHTAALLGQHGRIVLGVDGGQRQTADLRQQTTGEQFVR